MDRGAACSLRPDLVLTEAVCEVCAVPTGSVMEAVGALPHPPAVVSLDAHSLDGILATTPRGGGGGGTAGARREVSACAATRGWRRSPARVAGRRRPRVLTLERLDPPFATGHWVPEMVEAAGGDDLLGSPAPARARSRGTTLPPDPDVLWWSRAATTWTPRRATRERHRDRPRESRPARHRGGARLAAAQRRTTAAPVRGWWTGGGARRDPPPGGLPGASLAAGRALALSEGRGQGASLTPPAEPSRPENDASFDPCTRLPRLYVGALLIAAPWILGFAGGGMESWVFVDAGRGRARLQHLHRLRARPVRRIEMPVHLWLDGISGVLLMLSPWMFAFDDASALPHLVAGRLRDRSRARHQHHPRGTSGGARRGAGGMSATPRPSGIRAFAVLPNGIHAISREQARDWAVRARSGVAAAPGGRSSARLDRRLQPRDEEAAFLREELGFHPLAVEDCIRGRQRPKLDRYPSYFFMVVYAASVNPGRRRMALNELHIFLGRASSSRCTTTRWGR